MISPRVALGAVVLLAVLLAALPQRLSAADSVPFLTATAREGDGLYTLLRRYELPINTCYQRKFEEINGLSPKRVIRAGRDYRLPVLVYAYNGKSIRSTIGVDDLEIARQIQRYNRGRERAKQQATPYEQSRKLWVPYGLLFCGSDPGAATPKPDDGPTRYAIFGERYASVKRVDYALAGKEFYLVSGHGGPDPGALGRKRGHRLCEDEYAYDVALRLARNIIAHGGVPYVIVRDEDDGIRDEVYLDCDWDERVWGDQSIPRDQRLRLKQRSDVINELARTSRAKGVGEQYCIVIHVDSRHVDNQTDLFLYKQHDDPASERLGEQIRQAMISNYARLKRSREYQGALRTRDLHMLREVDVPTVYIELGNIQHEFDQQRVLMVSNRQLLADWFTEGILAGVEK